MLLTGKTALITGGNRGIGRAIAEEFYTLGANVAINYVEDKDGAEALAKSLTNERHVDQKAMCIHADIASPFQVNQMVVSALEEFGSIDVLVNNAGVQTETPFLDLTEDEVNRVIDVNLKGTFFVSQSVARAMARKGKGSIIMISSIHQDRPREKIAHYAASKGGIRMLVMVMALELATYGIRVNSVCPGAVLTAMNEVLIQNRELNEAVRAKIPLGRFGNTEELAKMVAFLASDLCDYVTGSTIVMDGGLHL